MLGVTCGRAQGLTDVCAAGDDRKQVMGLPTLVVDDWIAFEVPLEAVLPLCTLRLRLAAAFAAKVHSPAAALPAVLQASVQTAAQLLSMEGSGDVALAVAAAQGVMPGVAPPAYVPY